MYSLPLLSLFPWTLSWPSQALFSEYLWLSPKQPRQPNTPTHDWSSKVTFTSTKQWKPLIGLVVFVWSMESTELLTKEIKLWIFICEWPQKLEWGRLLALEELCRNGRHLWWKAREQWEREWAWYWLQHHRETTVDGWFCFAEPTQVSTAVLLTWQWKHKQTILISADPKLPRPNGP